MIAHLCGKVLRRKRDGSLYRISERGQAYGKPACYLVPTGTSWGDTRSHWKTDEKVLCEFEVVEGVRPR